MVRETSISNHILSKSTFVRGCQCIKSLWMHKHTPELKDTSSAEEDSRRYQGKSVGELARQLFPGGVDASPPDSYQYQHSVAVTQQFINDGHSIIYEAAFQFEGVLAAIDILVKKKDHWYAYEVKCSASVKEHYKRDAALQYYVLSNAGVAIKDFSIVHLNNQYIRQGELDLEELFTVVSVKREIKALQPEIAAKVAEFKLVVASETVPNILLGKHCEKPDVCDFYAHCWKDVTETIDYGLENIDRKELKAFMSHLEYPLYFMDFETYQVAVPEHDGHWPYRQVPFQFSVHVKEKEDGEVKHYSYLAENNCDPCPEFVKELVNVMDDKGSVIVYNKTFENLRLQELKDDYPKFKKQIKNIQSRMVDLMVPFKKKHFYLPEMKKSHSIKSVLPALVPELSYQGLEIGNGIAASDAFYRLRFESDQTKIQKVRQALLDYCRLDTLAMVRIMERIKQTTNK